MTDQVIVSRNDHILDIQLNRPDKMNALTFDMYRALTDQLLEAEDNLDTRVIVLRGAGGNYTSGNDVADFLANPPRDENAPALRFISAIARSTVPIVAAVEGVAVGVGTTMLLHCDYILTTVDARLQFPFVNLALLPEAGSTYLLPRNLGHTKASELMLLAEPFSGADAVNWGIASRVVDAEKIEAEALTVATKIASKPPKAVRLTKKMLKGEQARVDAAIAEESRIFGEQMSSPEAREAFTAFMEKREPDFSKLAD